MIKTSLAALGLFFLALEALNAMHVIDFKRCVAPAGHCEIIVRGQ